MKISDTPEHKGWLRVLVMMHRGKSTYVEISKSVDISKTTVGNTIRFMKDEGWVEDTSVRPKHKEFKIVDPDVKRLAVCADMVFENE